MLQHATYISPVSLKTDLGPESEPEHATYILYHLYNLWNDVKCGKELKKVEEKIYKKKKKMSQRKMKKKKKKLGKKKFG